MGAYVATVNVPGYLPMDDDPPVFSDARSAWHYLRGERERDLEQRWDTNSEDVEIDEDDSALETIDTNIANGEGEGSVWGTGPSIEHDLGLAYSVTYDESASIEGYDYDEMGETPDSYLDRIDGHWYVVHYDRTLPQIHARDCATCLEYLEKR